MGNITKKYKEQIAKLPVVGEEVLREQDPYKYHEQEKVKRMHTRAYEFLSDAVESAALTPAQLSAAMGKDVYEKTASQKWTQAFLYADAFKNYIKENRKDLWESFTKEQLELIDNNMAQDLYKDLVKTGKITAEEFGKLQAQAVWHRIYLNNQSEPEKIMDIVENLEKQMTPEQIRTVEGQLDSYQDVLSLPEEKLLEYPYAETCKQLKKNAPDAIKNNPEKMKEYEDALDFAAKTLSVPIAGYKEELKEQEKNSQETEVAHEKIAFRDYGKTYKNGRYLDIFSDSSLHGRPFHPVKRDAKKI